MVVGQIVKVCNVGIVGAHTVSDDGIHVNPLASAWACRLNMRNFHWWLGIKLYL